MSLSPAAKQEIDLLVENVHSHQISICFWGKLLNDEGVGIGEVIIPAGLR